MSPALLALACVVSGTAVDADPRACFANPAVDASWAESAMSYEWALAGVSADPMSVRSDSEPAPARQSPTVAWCKDGDPSCFPAQAPASSLLRDLRESASAAAASSTPTRLELDVSVAFARAVTDGARDAHVRRLIRPPIG